MHHLFSALLLAAALASPAVRAADAAANANTRVPEARYDSAFTGYRPYREQAPAQWRAVNDEVHKAGGHIGIFGGAHGHHGAKPAAAAPRQENKK